MKKEMNKKAQEGVTIGTLILIVLGIVVLVTIIIGFTTGFGFITDKFEIAPGQNLEAVAQSCKISAETDLKIDYCTFKEISVDGKDQFVNCEDQRVQIAIKDDIDNKVRDCNGLDNKTSYCANKVIPDKWEVTLVNNELCSTFTCEELGGTIKESCLDTETAGKAKDGTNCCKPK